jgi:NAD(P)-dependent dehydrogenase (short-subunit alcohol dehydrogenase family)
MHCLVVGGTGILRPAALALAARGHTVTVVARRPGPLEALAAEVAPLAGSVHPQPADWHDPDALERAVGDATAARGPFDLGLLYLSDAPDESLRRLAARARPARVVHVLVSRHGAPGLGPAERERAAVAGTQASCRVLLGWDASGAQPRWHTPEEVSRAALAAADALAGEVVLGTVRPWSQRPTA